MDAISGEDEQEWRKAMKEEYDALIANQTWEVIPQQKGKKVEGSWWHFVLKLKPDGEVVRHKAKFVA